MMVFYFAETQMNLLLPPPSSTHRQCLQTLRILLYLRFSYNHP